jgi:hypothetical protein
MGSDWISGIASEGGWAGESWSAGVSEGTGGPSELAEEKSMVKNDMDDFGVIDADRKRARQLWSYNLASWV